MFGGIMEIDWYSDMTREISGFGGGYEATCRKMVIQGARWLADNPQASPKLHGFKGIYGICVAENDDAKSFEKAMMDGVDDCTGAMHQACVGHAIQAHRIGWDNYRKIMAVEDNKECQALFKKLIEESVAKSD
jgi:hypothetical protein